MKLKDLKNLKFGKLTVFNMYGKINRRICWICDCECGSKNIIVRSDFLCNGTTKSCGCIVKTQKGLVAKERKMYHAWRNMLRRCYDTTSEMYYAYGKRGITVCEKWKNSFIEFVKDMGTPFDKSLQIDRLDNNGNYEPSNCRWITCAQNNLNRRNNRIITAFDKSKTIKEWSNETGYSSNIIRQRIDREKWPIEKALTTFPVRTKPPIKKRRINVVV